MTKDEALDLALEALEHIDYEDNDRDFLFPYQCTMLDKAITAIKQACALDKKAENARELGLDYEPMLKDNSNYRLDPPVAEPVAWAWLDDDEWQFATSWSDEPPTYAKPLYTTPPAAQRQWVGLTNEERFALEYTPQGVKRSPIQMSFATEDKLKEKNNG